MERYTIDRSTWRCGSDRSDPKNRHGSGETELLNEQGFACCLGHIGAQLLSKKWMCPIKDSQKILLGKQCPDDVGRDDEFTPLLIEKCDTNRSLMSPDFLVNSEFSKQAMSINDNDRSTLKEKEQLLIALGKEHDVEIVFVGEYIPGKWMLCSLDDEDTDGILTKDERSMRFETAKEASGYIESIEGDRKHDLEYVLTWDKVQ